MGWTWYMGSAGWMYQLIIESFLGMQQQGNKLKFAPCVPEEWDSFKIHYRYWKTMYHIIFIRKQSSDEMLVTVDGVLLEDKTITLMDDGAEYNVEILLIARKTNN